MELRYQLLAMNRYAKSPCSGLRYGTMDYGPVARKRPQILDVTSSTATARCGTATDTSAGKTARGRQLSERTIVDVTVSRIFYLSICFVVICGCRLSDIQIGIAG